MQENNRSELERLDQEQQADFLNMLKGFVHNQVHFLFWWAYVNLSSYLGNLRFFCSMTWFF